VLDFGQEPDGLLYLAMEHLDGESLSGSLDEGRPLPLKRIVDLMLQICAGLAHAHARGIVHRDVKPDNIMLLVNEEEDERPHELVKVCDFGIALEQTDGAPSHSVVGTPDYMSPEQCRGEALDGRSDVYSCGVMMYELATGHMPFTAPTPTVLLHHHVHDVPVPPRQIMPDVDPRLDAIIVKALSKEPSRRQGSMRELRRELAALVDAPSLPPSLPPMPSAPPAVASVAPEPPRAESAAGAALATQIMARPSAWLSAFADAQREEHFESLASQLEIALPLLLRDRRMKTLFAVRSTLDELAADAARHPAWRVSRARRLQQMFVEPAFLLALAEAALREEVLPREIKELVLRIGAPAAFALYSVRLKMSEVVGVRRRFVLLVRELGVSALPTIRAGLARLESKREIAVASELAADLLEASPRIRDREAGALAVRYLQGSAPWLAAAAAEALVAHWGARAVPELLGLLSSPEEAVNAAALAGLRELRVLDDDFRATLRSMPPSG
jgi:eukaryotic-like serine/threonine-protein kinase